MSRLCWLLPLLCLVASGCAIFPDCTFEPQCHNPFPQLSRVAVLPFNNLSGEPTLSGMQVADAYYNELQQVPGFEVMPVRAAVAILQANQVEMNGATDFQAIARLLGVDAIIVGAVTEYSPYYPPRMGLAVNWYAANPGFHPIPPGYGLPWGTAEEEFIPRELVFEAEFALAKEQLATQTPQFPPAGEVNGGGAGQGNQGDAMTEEMPAPLSQKALAELSADDRAALEALGLPGAQVMPDGSIVVTGTGGPGGEKGGAPLPADWPDPRGFVPAPPAPERPPLDPFYGPIIEVTRNYNGNDSDFTTALANYYYFRDDARFGGWQGYLQRSEDFIGFCCYLHLHETLTARGGASEARLVWRWPIDRYER